TAVGGRLASLGRDAEASAVSGIAETAVGETAEAATAAAEGAGELGEAGGGSVRGYRAVSKAEAEDIAKNGFRPEPSGRSMGDKWFSESREGAEMFRNDSRFGDLTDVVEADVPMSVYERSFKHPNIDGTGPGFCVQCEDLPLLTPR
ncbi:MAG: hypothetical protein D6746_09695, partial [Bacteroidetes bacterium]